MSKLQTTSIQALLEYLGVTGVRGRDITPLFARTEFEHLDLLRSAHANYRRLAKELHSDLGGDVLRMAELNLVWERVRKIFANRGVKLCAI